MIGPITLEAKVHFAIDDDNVIGSANVGLSVGEPVTLEALHRAVGQTLEALPANARLLTPDEFFNKVLVKEKTGRVGKFAIPSSFQYDVDDLASAARAAYTPEPEPTESANDESADDGWKDEDDDDEV